MKSVLIGLIVAGACFGQSTFQQLFLNKSTTGVSAVVRNTGQQYHRLDIFATTGNLCAGTGGQVFLEGSADNVSFIPIGAPVEQLNSYSNATGSSAYHFEGSTSASGSYAYVRVNILKAFDGCPLTVNYTGTINGTLVGSQPFTAAGDTFTTVIFNQNVQAAQDIYHCSTTGAALQVYAVALSATGGANTATLSMLLDATPVWSFNIGLTATNPNWIQPHGSRPYFTVPTIAPTSTARYTLMLALSAATRVDYNIGLRCE